MHSVYFLINKKVTLYYCVSVLCHAQIIGKRHACVNLFSGCKCLGDAVEDFLLGWSSFFTVLFILDVVIIPPSIFTSNIKTCTLCLYYVLDSRNLDTNDVLKYINEST